MHLTAQKYTTNSCRGYSYADPERFVRGGPTVTFFVVVGFLLDEGREYQNTTKSGSLSLRQRNVTLAGQ